MNTYLKYPYTGIARHKCFGKFEIPALDAPTIQFDSFHRCAAFIHEKYVRGEMHIQISADEALQKIPVHDLVFALWGDPAVTLAKYDVVERFLADLAVDIKLYNELTSDKLELTTTTFYSDNPEHAPGTMPRFVIARIQTI